MRRAEERRAEISEPVRIGTPVVVQIGHDVAGGCREPRVPRAGESAVGRPNQTAGVLLCDGGGRVGGPVVTDDNPVTGIREPPAPRGTIPERAGSLVRPGPPRRRRP